MALRPHAPGFPSSLGAAPVRLADGLDSHSGPLPLHATTPARALEAHAASTLPPHTLMQRAGRSVARLARAVAPHARRVWILAGPGNNGGDGFEAATHLRAALGERVEISVSHLGDPARLPVDAAASRQAALAQGIHVTPIAEPPAGLDPSRDLVIDALLGRGLGRAVQGPLAQAIESALATQVPVLAVDLPSGLPADTGWLGDGAPCVRARWTLALLSLPPGLFTADGRDACGDIWWDDLGVAPALAASSASAWLATAPAVAHATEASSRRHAHHKGSYGDVHVLGGAQGMGGALGLAARAALCAGAGRVYLSPIDPGAAAFGAWPELMQRDLASTLAAPDLLSQATVVAGCGGGMGMGAILPAVLQAAARLVLDADALNACAADAALHDALRSRAARGLATVLTPHPLEAARLLTRTAAEVQADRLAAAQALAQQARCTVVLKGSGSIVASPGQAPWLLPVGNAALATPGSGDVLAGWLGGLWSQAAHRFNRDDDAAHTIAANVARLAVWQHGRAAECTHPDGRPLPAGDLLHALQRAAWRGVL